MQYVKKSPAELTAYQNNSRVHSEEQIARIENSINEFGFLNPVIIDTAGMIVAGHARVQAALNLGITEVPCVLADHLTPAQVRAYVVADNRLAELSDWDNDILCSELQIIAEDFDLSLVGWEDFEFPAIEGDGNASADSIPEDAPTRVQLGEVWQLGDHRLMCGDSTDYEQVAKLMDGSIAQLLHADPPYGMNKEGVLNDDLKHAKLDEFQMLWWNVFRSFMEPKASAYIWGNAPDLWRLWYVGGLSKSEKFEFCNHITWDKNDIAGMKSDIMTQYPIASEHCLFFKLGEQFKGSINSKDFPADWQPLLDYLKTEADTCGITAKTIKEICDCQMYSHWFTRSQFSLIPKHQYLKLSQRFSNNFKKPWEELKRLWAKVRNTHSKFRSYFDNGHDIMHDVWNFRRVIGEERFGHATPKPVEMMNRIMISSLPERGICVEPFGGTGSTLISAQETGRICYTMELSPKYCDIIVKRWEDLTGQCAKLIE